jgi:hypothetical protein
MIVAIAAALVVTGCIDVEHAAPSGWQCNCIKSSA